MGLIRISHVIGGVISMSQTAFKEPGDNGSIFYTIFLVMPIFSLKLILPLTVRSWSIDTINV